MTIQDKIAALPNAETYPYGRAKAERDLALEVLREASAFWGRIEHLRPLSTTEENLRADASAVLAACGKED